MNLRALLLLAAAACSQARPQKGDLARPVAWVEDVAPLFAAQCAPCHSGSGYRTTSYGEAIAQATAGDAASPLVRALQPGVRDATHIPVASAYDLVRAWVVDGRLAYRKSGLHEAGVLNPRDSEFHGAMLQASGWNFGLCTPCHGADFASTAAGTTACTQCHVHGPMSCDGCHGDPPASGAHAGHAAVPIDCTACHPKPSRWDDGHADAKLVIAFARGGTFDGATCSSVYCHGTAKPSWVGGSAECGSCHGNPPASHDPSSTTCTLCHPASAPHVDGIVQVGDGSGTCTACHGQPPATGAHVAHVSGTHKLTAPMACSACHPAVAQIHDPGHFDHAPPATVAFSGGGAWNGTSCSSTYCHKAFTPLWAPSDLPQAYCGSCHALPPADPDHAGIKFPDCNRCHPTTVAVDGNIIIENGASTHVNGVVDVVP
ncbi:MAG TPA: CxxxxCH/CxxCH domain-containing protein [Myxococcales bacterium]|nr:CxxxxCH/CxxCH domain-containing protein [Myxococcales bacterium]